MRAITRLIGYLPLSLGLIGLVVFLTYGLVTQQLLPPGLVPVAGVVISLLRLRRDHESSACSLSWRST